MDFRKLVVLFVAFFIASGGVNSRLARAQHGKMDIHVINKTQYHVGVAIENLSWIVEPWQNRTELTHNGYCYECHGHTHIVIQCNERGFRRAGLMEELGYQDNGRWVLDVGSMVGGGHHTDHHDHH